MISDKIRLYKILPKVNIKTQLHIFFPFSYQQFRCYEGVFQYANQLLQIGMPCIWSKCLGIFRSQFLTLMYHLWSQATGLLFFFSESVSIRNCFFSRGVVSNIIVNFHHETPKNDEPPILDVCILLHGWRNNLTNKFLDDCIDCHLFSKFCPDVCWLRGVFAAPKRLWIGWFLMDI